MYTRTSSSAGPILVILMLGAAAIGAFYYWKESQRQSADYRAAAESSGIAWCGSYSRITEDGSREKALACMSDALATCARASMEDRSNIIATEVYEIVGPTGPNDGSCRVKWTQRAKPPQMSSTCTYPMSLIKQADRDNLFTAVALRDINDPSYCQ